MRKSHFDSCKRIFDLVASSAGLVVLSPVIFGIAIMVRIKLGSPVLFRQRRPGKDGEIFTLYKFRTMKNVDEGKGDISNEERMTSFGRKVRSTSIDELPSLVNVLRGEMSMVGPRPLLVEYLDYYTPEQARRHEVRPGVTGWAQVNGRNSIDWDEKFRLDVEYVDNRSLQLDLRILTKTIAQVFSRDGIESEGHVVGAPFTGEENGS